MRSAMRRGLTTATALLTALVAALWFAAPAQAHDGVNVTLHTDGSGGVWGVVTYVDGHPITDSVNAILLAVSADDPNKRVGPLSLKSQPGQADGTLRYDGVLEPGEWRVTFDVASPGIASCAFTITAVAVGSAPTPTQQVCAASFWPTAAPESSETGSTTTIVALVAVGAVLLAIALFIAMRARRDRPGGGGPGRPGGRGPSGPAGAGRPRAGAGKARTR